MKNDNSVVMGRIMIYLFFAMTQNISAVKVTNCFTERDIVIKHWNIVKYCFPSNSSTASKECGCLDVMKNDLKVKSWCSLEPVKCVMWARGNECEKNPEYMWCKCRVSCMKYAGPSYDKVCVSKIKKTSCGAIEYRKLSHCKRNKN